jgi:hypothetical protein
VTVDLLVTVMDEISPAISKEWVGLILLPTISSVAGNTSILPVYASNSRSFQLKRMHNSCESLCKGRVDPKCQRGCRIDHSQCHFLSIQVPVVEFAF